MSNVQNEGKEAYQAGLMLESNPFDPALEGGNHAAWEADWREASRNCPIFDKVFSEAQMASEDACPYADGLRVRAWQAGREVAKAMKIHEEGLAALKAGQPLSANPYKGQDGLSWFNARTYEGQPLRDVFAVHEYDREVALAFFGQEYRGEFLEALENMRRYL